MTIFEPNKGRFRLDALLTFLIMAVTAGIFYAVYLYQGMVEFRHTLKKQEVMIADLESESAVLRGQMYAALDAGGLLEAAGEEGLVIDQRPVYLRPSAPAVAQDL